MDENDIPEYTRTVQQRGTGEAIYCNIPSTARDVFGLAAGMDVTIHVDKDNELMVIEPTDAEASE